jgi:hypothetical protein
LLSFKITQKVFGFRPNSSNKSCRVYFKDSKKLVWHFSEFLKNFYKFLKITAFELRGGTEILQSGPQKELNQSNLVLGSSGKRNRDANSSDGGRRRRGGTGQGGLGD